MYQYFKNILQNMNLRGKQTLVSAPASAAGQREIPEEGRGSITSTEGSPFRKVGDQEAFRSAK